MVTPIKAIEIFNACGTTRELAKFYCLSTGEIAKIKNGVFPYDTIITAYKRQNLTKLITAYKRQNLTKLITGGFGYDKDFTPFEKFKLF